MEVLLDEIEASTPPTPGRASAMPPPPPRAKSLPPPPPVTTLRGSPPPVPAAPNVTPPSPVPAALPPAKRTDDEASGQKPTSVRTTSKGMAPMSAPPKAPPPDRPPKAAPPVVSPKAGTPPAEFPPTRSSAPPPLPTQMTPSKVVVQPPPTRLGDGTPPPLPDAPQPPPATLVESAKALVAECEAEIAHARDDRRRAQLHFEIARLQEWPIGDGQAAMRQYQEARKRAPESMPVLQGLRRVLLAKRSFAAALPLFDDEIRMAADPREKASLLLDKGHVLEGLGRKDEARAAFTASLELDRTQGAVLRALMNQSVDDGRHADLEALLERAANHAEGDPAHRAALVVRRAQLVERELEQSDRAIELYETALRLDAKAPGALAALKRLHHDSRRWRDLIRVLTLEADLTEDPAVRTAALYRVGRLHAERLGNRNEALAALERATTAAPNDPAILSELARLYERAGRYDALAEALRRVVQSVKNPRERLGMLHRIGALEEHRLGRLDAAIHWYEAALSIDPGYRPSVQAVASLHAANESWERLVQLHLAEAAACNDPSRRAACHVRVAELLEHLGKIDEAIEQHEKALTAQPEQPAAFKALTRLLAAGGRHRDLLEVYDRAIAQARDVEHKIAHLFKVAAIHEDTLGEHAQAAQVYRRVLALESAHLGAIHALQRTSERAGQTKELLEAIDREIALTTDPSDRVPLIHRAGELLEHRLADRDGAIDRHREVLALDAGYAPSLSSLGRLYHAAGRWEDLRDIYERELLLDPDPDEAIALLQRTGELCSERLGREEDARGYYRRVLEVDPTYGPARQALTDALEANEDWSALAQVYEGELASLREPTERARVLSRLGELREERQGDDAQAAKAYQAALDAVAGYRPAVDGLSRVRTRDAAWTAMAQDLRRECDASEDPQMAIDALLREGELWAHRLREPKRAIACYEGVLERAPTHVGALLALEELYRQIGRGEALARVHAGMALVFTDAPSRIAALHAQTRTLESMDSANEEEDGASVYRSILELDPADSRALRALEALATESGDPRAVADAERRLAIATGSVGSRAAHLTRLGESLEALGESGALESFREALKLDPKSLGATRGLSRVATVMDDPTVLAEAARQEASIARDGSAAAELLVRSARVRTERLGDVEGAVEDLSRALELAPDSSPAARALTGILRARGEHGRLAEVLTRAATDASPQRAPEIWMDVAEIHAEDLGKLPAAIGALTRVIRTTPSHVPSLRRLAEYYRRDEQWNEAVSVLGRVVQLTKEADVLLAAHLGLAALWDDHLGDTQRAMVSLQAVLSLDGGNPEALLRLAELHEREGRLDDAASAAKRLLLSVVEEGPARARALVHLARVERARGNDAAAADALREAVSLEGPGSESALECKALTTSTAAWDQYLTALEHYMQRVTDDQARAPVYLEMGRVLFDQLERPSRGIEVLELGASTCAEPQLERELAHRLRTTGQTERAVVVLQKLIAADPARAESWRELARTYEDGNLLAEARLATEPLVLLGQATDQDHRRLERAPARPARGLAGSLESELLDRLGSPTPEQQIAGELLRVLEPALSKLYPPDFESYNLSSRDRLSTRGTVHPLRQLADEIGGILGAPAFDLYVHEERSRGLSLELASPPAVVIPAAALELPESHQVFLLARPLIHITRQFPAVAKLTPRELEVLLASAARNVQEKYGAGLTSEEFLDEQAKRIYKATPRRQRKALEEAARAYIAAPRVDFTRWARAALRTANRAAALLSDDLLGTIEVLRRTERDLAALKGVGLVRESEVVRDLITFWPSAAAMHLRHHTGIIPAAGR